MFDVLAVHMADKLGSQTTGPEKNNLSHTNKKQPKIVHSPVKQTTTLKVISLKHEFKLFSKNIWSIGLSETPAASTRTGLQQVASHLALGGSHLRNMRDTLSDRNSCGNFMAYSQFRSTKNRQHPLHIAVGQELLA